MPVSFFMKGCSDGRHVEAATRALMDAISRPGRPANKYNALMIEAEFRDRLVLATEGKLRPSDHVRSIDLAPPVEMFEIRWVDLAISEVDVAGDVAHSRIHVRLYYVEREWFVLGVHVHEKLIVPGDDGATVAAQDEEIRSAIDNYKNGFAGKWGVPELR